MNKFLLALVIGSSLSALAQTPCTCPQPTPPPAPSPTTPIPVALTTANFIDFYKDLPPTVPTAILQFSSSGILVAPQPSTSTRLVPDGGGGKMPQETHAYQLNIVPLTLQNFDLKVVYQYVGSTRKNLAPMAWEMPSLFVNFTGTSNNTLTGTWILPKNGSLQIETLRGNVGESNMFEYPAPKIAVGDTVTLEVIKKGHVFTVIENGVTVINGITYSVFDDVAGTVALYGEDSEALWKSVAAVGL